MNEIVNYSPQLLTATAHLALCEPNGENYTVRCMEGIAELIRGVDFGVIPGTRSPTLYKPGAEKIIMAYGLLVYTNCEKAEENFEKPFFYYRYKCELKKIVNGVEYVLTTGHGNANTSEKRNGRNSPYDAANATEKIAEKRSIVDAALHISGLSDAFVQDMENESFMQKADLIIKEDPESPISAQQIKRLFAVAGDRGLTQAEAKKIISEIGYQSTKAIPKKAYNDVINALMSRKDN